MHNTENWITLGCFGRPHGIKGWISLHSFTTPRDNILNYPDWHMQVREQWVLCQPLDILVQSKAILLLLEDYPTRESVSQLTNCHVGILSTQLPMLPEGEYYWNQLLGLQVTNKLGIDLGQICEILSTGSNDVLVVNGTKRHLLPYLPGKVVLDVDLAKGKMHVDWDEDF